MLDQDQLLDDNNATNATQLTDRQIVGLLLDKKKFPEKIIIALEFELHRRNLSSSYLKEIESELSLVDHAPTLSFSKEYKRLLVFGLIIQSFMVHFLIFFWQIILFTTSIKAIKNRFTKGASYQKSTWRKFEWSMLLLIIIIYVAFYFLT